MHQSPSNKVMAKMGSLLSSALDIAHKRLILFQPALIHKEHNRQIASSCHIRPLTISDMEEWMYVRHTALIQKRTICHM